MLRTGVLLATTLFPLPLFAQTESRPPRRRRPAPAAPAEPAARRPGGSADAAKQLAAVTAVQAEPAPGPAAEPTVAATTPAPTDGSAKPLDVAVWGRLGNNIATPEGGDADAFADAEVNLLLGGRIHKYVGWQADFVATYGPGVDGTKSTASILDLIGKFELHDAFNVWFGRMLVPSDRSNFSGAWFMGPWTYPGFFVPGGAPIGPRQGPFGRNDGATVWGQFGGGLLKYYASVFDLTAPQTSPLYSGRINLALINPEPGYYHSSTYYGGKDILALGVSAQYKKDGSVAPVDPITMMGPAAGRLHRPVGRRAVREEPGRRGHRRPGRRVLHLRRGQRGLRLVVLRPGQLPAAHGDRASASCSRWSASSRPSRRPRAPTTPAS